MAVLKTEKACAIGGKDKKAGEFLVGGGEGVKKLAAKGMERAAANDGDWNAREKRF